MKFANYLTLKGVIKMKNVKKFFEEVIKTEEAKAILTSIKEPETEQERIDAYLEIAKKLGIELSAESVLAYINAADINEPASGELDDEELAQLTGGGNVCSSTYQNEENCWFSDGCDIAWNKYDSYRCNSNDSLSPEKKKLRATQIQCGQINIADLNKKLL